MFWLLQLLLTAVCAFDDIARHEILREKLANYSRAILPTYQTGDPVNVRVMVIIRSMDSLSEATMDYSMTIYLREWWHDPRLAYTDTTITGPLQLDVQTMEKLWVPDLFFVNGKTASFHDVTVPNKLLHIYKNGTVFHSTRISLTLSCNMDLTKYPLDSQICPIEMESYSYTTEMLKFTWDDHESVLTSHDLELPHFHLEKIVSKDCTKSYGAAGTFTCISAELSLVRKLGYYLCQVYIPSMLIVVLSWVSFWLDVDTVPARISLGVLTVLMITSQTAGFSNSLPKVSYIKAIDVWMAMCLLFVFSALIEFSVVNVYSRGGRFRLNTSLNRSFERRTPNEKEASGTNNGDSSGYNGDGVRSGIPQDTDNLKRASRIDHISRVAFPIAFLLFNLAYWLILVWT